MKREKDIQDPIMHTHIGQLRIPQRHAIKLHIAQFWNPQNHTNDDVNKPKPTRSISLDAVIRRIQSAPSIRGVKSLTRRALASRETIEGWNQSAVQQEARKRKTTLRRGRRIR